MYYQVSSPPNLLILTQGEEKAKTISFSFLRDFPFRGGYRFRDQETGEELLGDGAALREDFLRRFAAARTALDARLDASGIRHAEYVLDEALDLPLRRLFGAGAA